MPLFSSTDGYHAASGFARLDDHNHSVALRVCKVRLDEVVGRPFWTLYDFHGATSEDRPNYDIILHLSRKN